MHGPVFTNIHAITLEFHLFMDNIFRWAIPTDNKEALCIGTERYYNSIGIKFHSKWIELPPRDLTVNIQTSSSINKFEFCNFILSLSTVWCIIKVEKLNWLLVVSFYYYRKRKKIPKEQSKMDNPKKLAT